MAELNCIKAVLAEKGIMSKWLAKTLQKIRLRYRSGATTIRSQIYIHWHE